MRAWAYYNEFDPAAADWLRRLITHGLVAPGEVDTRSITEVQPHDLDGFCQAHFFAGIGGWSHALRLAGWGDDRPIWTGSCPCQPFSQAGKGAGVDDARHLWPDFFRLIRARRPAVAVGEQVAGAAGYGWFDGVAADLATENYASRCVDVPACAVDAPHIRSRLYWVAVADAGGEPRQQVGRGASGDEAAHGRARRLEREPDGDHGPAGDDEDRRDQAVGDAQGEQRGTGLRQDRALGDGVEPANRDGDGDVGDAIVARLEGQRGNGDGADGRAQPGRSVAATDGGRRAEPLVDAASLGRGEGRAEHELRRGRYAAPGSNISGAGFWSDHDWIVCGDDKARRVADASASLLVNGVSGGVAVPRPDTLGIEGAAGQPALQEEVRHVSRIAAWRGFGNAIVPVLAAEVIGALIDVLPLVHDGASHD